MLSGPPLEKPVTVPVVVVPPRFTVNGVVAAVKSMASLPLPLALNV